MNRPRVQTPIAAVVPPSIRPGLLGPPEKAVPLKEAVYLSGTEIDATLFAERVLMGRAPHCRVIISDPLVSREHAVLRISPTEVVLEDLHSANGVYINNIRIYEPQQLFDGDRILMGTHELCAFSEDASSRPRGRPSCPVPTRPPASTIPRSAVLGSTARADALVVLGKLAEKLLEQDLPLEAERVLQDHLRKLLDGTRSGLPLPLGICESASQHALILAARLHNGRWVNYAIELHLRGQHPLSSAVQLLLEQALRASRNVDHALFGFYVEWVRDSVGRLGTTGRDLLVRLESMKLPI